LRKPASNLSEKGDSKIWESKEKNIHCLDTHANDVDVFEHDLMGLHHQIFTGEEGAAPADASTTELISQESLSTEKDFKTLVLNEF
jgi:hypothetical protein